MSDIVLSIAEDDEVGRLTNINLVNFLRFRKKAKNIYSIINKGRNISSVEDIKEKFEQQKELGVVGVIPFDIDIMENFGSDRFWYAVEETLYFRALIESWNNLAQKEYVKEITLKNYRFAPSIFMRKGLGKYSLVDRMLRFYSILFILAGIFYWAYDYIRELGIKERYIFSHELLSVTLVVMGVCMLLISTSNIRKRIIKFLLGNKW